MLGFLALLVVATVAPGAAYAQSGNVYNNQSAQSIGTAQVGIVLQVATKKVEASGAARTVGAVAGGALGTLLGANVDSSMKMAINILGASAGAFGGDRLANSVFGSEAQELVIGIPSKDGGDMRILTVVQPAPYDDLYEGDNVLVISNGGTNRVLRKKF